MEEFLKKFPNGIVLYNESVIFRKLAICICQGMPIENALVETINITEVQQRQMRKLIENQPQSIILIND